MEIIEKVPTTIRKEALDSLADQIKKDNEFLMASFKAKDFEAMAKLYDERHGVISTRNYEIIYGKDSSKFWSGVWSQDKTLEFKLTAVHLRDLRALQKETTKPLPEEAYDAVAFVTAEIHVVQKSVEGLVIHNDTDTHDLVYRHNGKCPWY